MSEETGRAELPPPPQDAIPRLWRRLKDHRIAQWTVGYVALAYGIQHAVVLTSESLDWPHAVERVTMLLLALGLPLAMTLAWYHGAKASRRISGPELSIISILLVGVSILFYVFVRPSEQTTAAPAVARQAGLLPTPAAPASGIALAVLPFANVSGDPGQEFFSDGMTDEIMTALAKVPSLRVVGRESAFSFKGKSQDNRAVGQALGAGYLIEGSVRKAGDRVRITAQLVQSDNGVSLWTESYDRELKDIFATQEDVAQAIAGALRLPLGLKEGEQLVSNRSSNVNSYQDYLRGRALVRSRQLTEASAVLEQAVARDPNYAPAWAMLSQAYRSSLDYSSLPRSGPVDEARHLVEATLARSEMAARKAIGLDPKHGGGYAALAQVQTARWKWSEAEDLYRQALALDANDPEALYRYAQNLGYLGRINESVRTFDRLRALEPFVPVYNIIAAWHVQMLGRTADSIALLESVPKDTAARYYRNVYLARGYAEAKRYGNSADTLLALRGVPQITDESAEAAARLIRSPATAKASTGSLVLPGELNFVYFYTGAPERQMEYPELAIQIGYSTATLNVIWSTEFASLRKTEQFKALVRKAGLVDYWRARGWPDLCHPVGQEDFVCD